MNENELRIGNLIGLRNAGIEQIRPVTSTCLYEGGFEDWYKPIRLNKNWLLKFGIKQDDGYFKLTDSVKLTSKYEPIECISLYSIGKKLKYVHQLQNLYFALTEIELNYKP